MVTISYKDNSKKIANAVRLAPRRLKSEMVDAMERHALFFEGKVLAQFARGNRVGPFKRNPSNKLGIRSGRTSRSMRHRIIGKSGKRLSNLRLRLTIGNANTPGLKILHDGGIIYARPGKKLAVPLPDNLTAAGNVRFKKLRRVSNTFIYTSKAGNAIVARKVGKGKRSKLKYLAILKDSVKIPARPFYVNVFNSRVVRADGERRFAFAANRALRSVGRRNG